MSVMIRDSRSQTAAIPDARSTIRDPRSALALRRRNRFTALALVFFAIPLVPYVKETRIGWFMWRDAPVLAITFTALALIMIIGWLRTPRT